MSSFYVPNYCAEPDCDPCGCSAPSAPKTAKWSATLPGFADTPKTAGVQLVDDFAASNQPVVVFEPHCIKKPLTPPGRNPVTGQVYPGTHKKFCCGVQQHDGKFVNVCFETPPMQNM